MTTLAATVIVVARAMSERELQDAVIECAKRLGYRVYHTYDSRRSERGFPDLCMVRQGCVIFTELKSERGRLSVEQMEWVSDLQSVVDEGLCLTDIGDQWFQPSFSVYVWRPSHWISGEIESVLRGTTARTSRERGRANDLD